MAEENKEKDNIVTAEFKVSMHCNACERSVAKIISKIKGVEKFITDMNGHKVVVIGQMDHSKVLKKLKKKTGKRVEMIVVEKEEEEEEKDDVITAADGGSDEPPLAVEMAQECEVYTIFSDENPNACSIM